MGSFVDSMKKNINRVLTEIDNKCYAIVYSLFTSVVYNSPTKPFARYSEGQFINNWFPSVGGYSNATTGSTSFDGMGSLSRILELKTSKAFYGQDNFVSMSNSLPYAQQVEYLGWSKTGPYAPVRNAITSFNMKDVAYDNT